MKWLNLRDFNCGFTNKYKYIKHFKMSLIILPRLHLITLPRIGNFLNHFYFNTMLFFCCCWWYCSMVVIAVFINMYISLTFSFYSNSYTMFFFSRLFVCFVRMIRKTYLVYIWIGLLYQFLFVSLHNVTCVWIYKNKITKIVWNKRINKTPFFLTDFYLGFLKHKFIFCDFFFVFFFGIF